MLSSLPQSKSSVEVISRIDLRCLEIDEGDKRGGLRLDKEYWILEAKCSSLDRCTSGSHCDTPRDRRPHTVLALQIIDYLFFHVCHPNRRVSLCLEEIEMYHIQAMKNGNPKHVPVIFSF